MIRLATIQDHQEIRRLYEGNANQANYYNYFFENIFDKALTLVNQQGNSIVCALTMTPQVVRIANKNLAIYFIDKVGNNSQNPTFLKELIDFALELASRKALLTYTEDKTLLGFGFAPTYYYRNYSVSANSIKKYDTLGISDKIEPQDLFTINRQFLTAFHGYRLPNVKGYEKLIKRVKANNGYIIGYYQQEKLQGYYVAYNRNGVTLVDEIVYLNGKALAIMLSHISNNNGTINIKVSKNENLEMFLPESQSKVEEKYYVRVNDVALMKKCFELEDSTIDSLFARKPLYFGN